jgi:hypothetical protein
MSEETSDEKWALGKSSKLETVVGVDAGTKVGNSAGGSPS